MPGLKFKRITFVRNKHLQKHSTNLTFYSSSTTFPAKTHLFLNPNKKNLSQLLKKRPNLSHLNQIHAQIITQQFSKCPSLIDSLIICYLSSHDLIRAKTQFDSYPLASPPILIWNVMIRAFSKIQFCQVGIELFRRMLSLDVNVDDYTYTFVITSCAHQSSLSHGEIVHGVVLKDGFGLNLYVGNALINLYCVSVKMEDARKVFDEMRERDVFSWTSLLCGYAKCGDMGRACDIFDQMPFRNNVSWTGVISGFIGVGRYIEALSYFRAMLCDDKPNEAILVCALSACSHLGALDQGNWIHAYIGKNEFSMSSNISTALIDMYAKCGKIGCAKRVFSGLSKHDVHNCTSMISGFSIHGLGNDALRVFDQMLAENIKPNDITFLGVLNGCSHSGLVKEGTSIFHSMEKSWGVSPKIEHYGCFIDLLGRSGHLDKAFDIVKSMPMEPDIVIWRSLLNGCKIYRNANLARRIVDHIGELKSCGYNGAEVLLSNLYASLGRWDGVIEVRKLMSERKYESNPGWSWIEVNGIIHEFRVADKLHPQIVEIRKKLKEVLERASFGGYVANTTNVSFDLIEEEKEQAVACHSEKLAVAFALMVTTPGSLIRIVKNLRTCEDCHLALKAISKVYGREIVVRDRSRFHTFNEGNCSCNDYW